MEDIFRKGDQGDRLYIVLNGKVDIILNSKVLTTFSYSDYFGEKSICLEEKRTATARAKTKTTLLAIQKEDMLGFIRDTECEKILRHLAVHQNEVIRKIMRQNPIIHMLTPTQETQLYSLINDLPIALPKDAKIIREGTAPDHCYAIQEGEVNVYRNNEFITALKQGDFFGTRSIIHENGLSDFTLIAKNQVKLLYIERAAFRQYLEKNPGVYIKFYYYPY